MPLTADDILSMILRNDRMMADLRAVQATGLPDWAIGAGFVRGFVWDHLHGFPRTRLDDVDVLYFKPLTAYGVDAQTIESDVAENRRNPVWIEEEQIEASLRLARPGVPWSVRNQARMHVRYGGRPFCSTADAIAHWVETPTCVAVTLRADDTLHLIAPYGLADLIDMVVRPTPGLIATRPDAEAVFRRRIAEKSWPALWPRVCVDASVFERAAKQ